MASSNIDLGKLFKEVSKAVADNQDSLNQADTYNHDHGDHMVEIFDVISQAMKEKKSADPADQLEYAAQLLRKQSSSGSAKQYSEGLKSAAKQMTGKELDANSVITMLSTILGSSAGTTSSGSSSSAGGDLLGSLIGGLSGSSSGSVGLDLGDLLTAGMSYKSAKQSGKSDLEALTGALVSGSQFAGESDARAQSTELVTSTLLSALTAMMKK
jgi:hypothetical protein